MTRSQILNLSNLTDTEVENSNISRENSTSETLNDSLVLDETISREILQTIQLENLKTEFLEIIQTPENFSNQHTPVQGNYISSSKDIIYFSKLYDSLFF